MTAPPQTLEVALRQELLPQRAFAYDRKAWLRGLGHFPGVETAINGLPAAVDRAIIASTVEELLRDDRVVPAFVTAMIWGHGRANYGPSRTAKLLKGAGTHRADAASESVAGKLAESVLRARGDGPVEGFRYLNNQGHIKGLGPAFFTKWLYFVTARGQEHSAQAAPVLDALIINWLRTEANLRIRYGKTPGYEHYLETLHAWGQPHQLTPVEVEERIFRLIRSDGISAG